MAIAKGTAGTIYDNATAIGNISQWNATFQMDMEETAALGDVAKKPMPTVYGGSGSMTGKYNKADGGQGGLFAKFTGGTAITLDLLEGGSHGGSGTGYTGTVYLSNIKITASWDKYDDFSADFTFYGAISYTSTA